MPRQRANDWPHSSSDISRPSGLSQTMSLTSAARRCAVPGRSCAGAAADARAGARETLRESYERRVSLAQAPVEPGDLVVLAIGVVVAALRAAELVAGQQHRHALRDEAASRGNCASAARAARGSRDRRSALRRRSSSCGCRSRRRGCPRRWPRCACRCSSRDPRSVKPSCAVTKLMLAYGRRPLSRVEIARAREPVRELADQPAVALPERRTASRYLPFHSVQPTGKLPTW